MTRWAGVAGVRVGRARRGRAAADAAAPGGGGRDHRPGRQRLPRPLPRPRGRRGGRRGSAALGGRRRCVPAGHRDPGAARAARARARGVPRAAGRAGLLDRLPRQPRRRRRAGRSRRPRRLRRARARLAGRRRTALEGRRRDRAAPRRGRGRRGARRRGRHAGRWCWSSRSTPCSATRHRWPRWPPCASGTTPCWSSTRRTVWGSRGPGLVRELGLAGLPHVLVTATLSKALGSQGGAVLGPQAVVDHLVNRARPFVFDTGLAPAAAGGALEALRQLRARPELSDVVRRRMADLAAALGVAPAAGAVLSVPMPSPQVALDAQATALAQGVTVGLLPAAVGARRDLPAAGHRQRGHPGSRLGAGGRRPRGGGQGVRVTVLVVTGTSTGVGKTVATAALAATATGSVLVVKPVQTGAARRRLRRPRGRPAHRRRGRGVDHARRATRPRHRRPSPRASTSPSWRRTPPGSRASRRTRWSSRGPAGCWSGSTPTGGTLLDLAPAPRRRDPGRGGRRGRRRARHAQPHRAHGRRAARPGPHRPGLVIGAWPAEPGLAEQCNLDDLPR